MTSDRTLSDRAAYESLEALNWSRLQLIGKSPLHFKQGFGDDSGSFELGSAAHAAVLEAARFAADFIVYPGPVRRGKAWEEFETNAVRAGKEVLKKSDYDAAVAIAAAVREHQRANELLSDGASEQAMVWERAGIKCKGRADYIGQTAIVDLKSTQCSAPRPFSYSCMKYGYFGQAAWYSDGYFKSTGKRLPFYFVAVESAAPHIVEVYEVDAEALAKGRELYMNYLVKLDECQRTGNWHGYTGQAETKLQIPEQFNPEVM